jgi:hypothetical protein
LNEESSDDIESVSSHSSEDSLSSEQRRERRRQRKLEQERLTGQLNENGGMIFRGDFDGAEPEPD